MIEASPLQNKRAVRFSENPVSKVHIVERVDKAYILSMFYQADDFAYFRYERKLELEFERDESRRRRSAALRQRDSMDLTRSYLGPQAQTQAPLTPPRPARSQMPNRSRIRSSLSPPPSSMRALRPCSQRSPTRAPSGLKKPMALAA